MILFTILSKQDIQMALQVAADSNSVHGWMWAVNHPDASELTLITLASKKYNPKLRAKALLHPNATDKVAEIVKDSRSIEICKAILQASNISDSIKESWIDCPAMIDGLANHGFSANQRFNHKGHYIQEKVWKVWAALPNHLQDKLMHRLKERVERYQRQHEEWCRREAARMSELSNDW